MKKLFEIVNKNSFLGRHLSYLKLFENNRQLPIITISREKGSGGRIIAYEVAKQLGGQWKVFHKEIVEQIARETNLTKELIDEVDEKNIPMIDEIVADFFGKRYLNLSSYYKHLLKILSTIAHRGNAVIVGRGANFLIKNALKIRIICDKEQRMKWLIQYEKFSRDKAIKMIEDYDKKRIEFNKNLFQKDPCEEHYYDMIIKTSDYLNVQEASKLIVRLARKRFGI